MLTFDLIFVFFKKIIILFLFINSKKNTIYGHNQIHSKDSIFFAKLTYARR